MNNFNKYNFLLVSSISKYVYLDTILSIQNCFSIKTQYKQESFFLFDFLFENVNKKINLFISNNLNINDNINYNGLIFLFDSFESFEFCLEFNEKFHAIFGNKNFPSIFVNVLEKNNNNNNNNYNNNKFNIFHFNEFNIKNFNEILNELFKEIEKDENDFEPFNKPYYKIKEEKNNKKIFFLFLFLICFNLILNFFDFYKIIFIQEFINQKYNKNYDYLNIKFYLNVIEIFLICFYFKFLLSKKNFIKNKIKICLYLILIKIFNIIFVQYYKIKKKDVKNINKEYFKCFNFYISLFLYFIMTFINYNSFKNYKKYDNKIYNKLSEDINNLNKFY